MQVYVVRLTEYYVMSCYSLNFALSYLVLLLVNITFSSFIYRSIDVFKDKGCTACVYTCRYLHLVSQHPDPLLYVRDSPLKSLSPLRRDVFLNLEHITADINNAYICRNLKLIDNKYSNLFAGNLPPITSFIIFVTTARSDVLVSASI